MSKTAFVLGLLSVLTFACSDDGDGTAGSTNQGGEAGSASTNGGGGQGAGDVGGAGAGGTMVISGGGGEGGTGGGPPPDPGPPGNAFVSAGEYASSPNYSLVHTTGQSTMNQTKMTSSNYRLHGGLIGATGSLP